MKNISMVKMRRFEQIKRLDKKTRNKLRAILSLNNSNAINSLSQLRGNLSDSQSEALDAVLSSPFITRAMKPSTPFPKRPPFRDTFQIRIELSLSQILTKIESEVVRYNNRIMEISNLLHEIDEQYAEKNFKYCRELISQSIEKNGWSHALLRRLVLLRENLPEGEEDEHIEGLILHADLKEVVVASLVHSYSLDQNTLTIKRSILHIPDRGALNRYSRTLSRLTVQPFAKSQEDLATFLAEVEKCSLIDAVILAKFNAHLFSLESYPALSAISKVMGRVELFEKLILTYHMSDSIGEYGLFKQCSAWLEYEPVRQYRILVDNYYDASREEVEELPNSLSRTLHSWVGDATLSDLVKEDQFTKHSYSALAKLEIAGTVTRSAIFNYWLQKSEGQIGFEREDLFKLMGLTRDLARTVPIMAARTAARLAQDDLVKLVLLLLLGKRSKNELDSFLLRKVLENIATKYHDGSLIKLVRSYEVEHPYVSEYIYEIATEDFLAKLNRLAPHRADIPAIRASLHEWMAEFTRDEHYLQRARTVRIDHQLNRVRNEIDDYRIYVDPSRFSSWIEDEMMIELSGALTSSGSGKKSTSVTCDETILNLVMTQCYSAFCSNAVFGIASYIGRRIRHGTFHGHLYSSVVNSLEKNNKFQQLFRSPQFVVRWNQWKDTYNHDIEEIIRDRLHVHSKSKPLGLLQPEVYGPSKLEILNAAVKNISTSFGESKTIAGIDQTIIDYCWRLAECDLPVITKYLKGQQLRLKNLKFLENDMLPAMSPVDSKLATAFYRELELSIDRKLASMFGWFKRPTIVAPKASVALLFDATVAEVKDTIPEFNPQEDDCNHGEIELIGSAYHIVYDSLAVVVANAAKHGDRNCPVRRKFEILPGKTKRLVVEISSSIRSTDNSCEVSADIERRKRADFLDANLYQGKSGISKLMLLAHTRHDFSLEQYEVVGNEVKVRLTYALEH